MTNIKITDQTGAAGGGATGGAVVAPTLCEGLVERIGTRLPDGVINYHWLAAGSVCTVSVGQDTRTGRLSLVRSQQLGGALDHLPGAAQEIALCKKLRTSECPPELALPTQWQLGRYGLLSSIYPSEHIGMFELFAFAERRVNSGTEWWIPNQFLHFDDTMAIVCPIVNAAAYLHRQGIVHCDLKPENCFVTPRGAIKVGDMGAAHYAGEHGRFAIGTAPFMAPECFSAGPVPVALDQVRPEIDVYALGLLANEMATGRCSLMEDFPGVPVWDIGIFIGISDRDLFNERSHILAKRDPLGTAFYDKTVAHWISPDPSVPQHDANFGLLAAILPAMMHPDPAMRPTTDGVARHFFGGELELSVARREGYQERVRQMFIRFCAPVDMLRALDDASATGNGALWCHLTVPMREQKSLGLSIEQNLVQQSMGYVVVNEEEIPMRLEAEYGKTIAKMA